MRTSDLEDKSSALLALRDIVKHCAGAALTHALPAILDAVVPLLRMEKACIDDIRANAAATLVASLA